MPGSTDKAMDSTAGRRQKRYNLRQARVLKAAAAAAAAPPKPAVRKGGSGSTKKVYMSAAAVKRNRRAFRAAAAPAAVPLLGVGRGSTQKVKKSADALSRQQHRQVPRFKATAAAAAPLKSAVSKGGAGSMARIKKYAAAQRQKQNKQALAFRAAAAAAVPAPAIGSVSRRRPRPTESTACLRPKRYKQALDSTAAAAAAPLLLQPHFFLQAPVKRANRSSKVWYSLKGLESPANVQPEQHRQALVFALAEPAAAAAAPPAPAGAGRHSRAGIEESADCVRPKPYKQAQGAPAAQVLADAPAAVPPPPAAPAAAAAPPPAAAVKKEGGDTAKPMVLPVPEAPAASPAAAAPAAAAQAGSHAAERQALYVIKCTRKSALVEHDPDSFIDHWNDEITDAEEEIDVCVTYRDGVWLFDMGWDPADCNFSDKHPADKTTAGLIRSAGAVCVYSSLAAANEAAALVWDSLQVNHGFKKVALGVISSGSSEYEDEGEEDEEEEEEECESAGHVPNVHNRAQAAQPEDCQQQEDLGGLIGGGSSSSAEFCTVRSDGRCSWSRTRQYYVDPWCDKGSEPLHNLVSSTCTVEVVKAQLE